MNNEEDKIWLASFDIGKVNFAFYIEEMDRRELMNLKNIPKLKRYKPTGLPTPEFKEVLDSVCINGKTILFKNTDITQNSKKGKYLDAEIFHNLTELLDNNKEYWDKCEAFIIEQQMSFGNKRNTMALKLGQHCYSYFNIIYGRFKSVVEFPSYHKTQILGAPKLQKTTKTGKVSYVAIPKPQRKKWSVKKAIEILEERGEKDVLSTLTTVKKKDDLADCLTQLSAFKYLCFIEKMEF